MRQIARALRFALRHQPFYWGDLFVGQNRAVWKKGASGRYDSYLGFATVIDPRDPMHQRLLLNEKVIFAS